MKRVITTLVCAALVLSTVGCASQRPSQLGEPEPTNGKRWKVALIAVGSAVVIGMILANQAEKTGRRIVGDLDFEQ